MKNGSGTWAVSLAAQHLGPIHAGTGGAGAFLGIGFAVAMFLLLMSNRG